MGRPDSESMTLIKCHIVKKCYCICSDNLISRAPAMRMSKRLAHEA